MRHLVKTAKLGRKSQHRNAMLANMACSLIKGPRITTTLPKAKALKPFVEKLVTLGKRGQAALDSAKSAGEGSPERAAAVAENVFARRLAAAKLRQQARTQFKGSRKNPGKVKRIAWKNEHDVVHILFDRIAPVFKDRKGGYCRIIKTGQRRGDVASMAVLEWVEAPLVPEANPAPATATPAA